MSGPYGFDEYLPITVNVENGKAVTEEIELDIDSHTVTEYHVNAIYYDINGKERARTKFTVTVTGLIWVKS